MRSRALLAGAVLATAVVSGGWLVERGLVGSRPSTTDRARMFNQVMQHIARDYVDTLSDSTIYTHAAEGLLGELHDPHTAYLSPKLYKSLTERTEGKYAGIGANVDVRDAWPTVVQPLPGGPAMGAGIQAGDRITEVDGQPMHGKTNEEFQKMLRGAPGSTVGLTVERPGVATALKFELTRREIHVGSVQHPTLLDASIGYVALTIFSDSSLVDLRRAIDSLRTAGMKTLIFDLRGNPGGLVAQGVGISDLFLDAHQRILTIRGRTPETTESFDDPASQPYPNLPIVVLVDSNTASAAEIVAGALQDHDRAVLLGTTTYGKGSAQNIFQLSDGGAAKLTTALWFTPSGRSINKKRDFDDDDPAADSSAKNVRPKFKTDDGRTVLGGGGITPDVMYKSAVRPASDTVFQRALGKQIPQFSDALTDYALSIKTSQSVTSQDFVVTPEMRAELLRRMRARGIKIDDATYVAATSLIDRVVGYEVARYVFGDQAVFMRRLRDDAVMAKALVFARGATSQKDLLDRATEAAK
ncbi:MAG TPA: S41 family peptidase [Gemmatimonadaceae bacterium]|jgi:carboxyl-terminal processing protease